MSLAGLNGGIRGEPTYLSHSNVVHHLHQTNLAEVGHSQWSKKGSYRLTLAMAAEEDVAEAIMLSKKLESYGYGSYKRGQHQSQNDRLKANYFQQMAGVKAFADEISAGVVNNSLYVAAESLELLPWMRIAPIEQTAKENVKSVFSAMELT